MADAQLDLLSPAPIAPHRRNSATSRDAAVKVGPQIKALHLLIIQALRRYGPLAPDEIADKLAMHWIKIRPRVTELHGEKYELFLIEPTGDKRISANGHGQDVFRLTEKAIENFADDRVQFRHAATVAVKQPLTHANPTAKNGTHAR